ncbi:MAG: hypothetical protein IJW26_06400 [Clostridia bacterium]|nr:hypothetical protein [Clostridia bacterium]
MSKKILIMLSITFIFLVCLVLGRHYALTAHTNVSIKGRNLSFNCMNNYSVIKKETDEKYILKINEIITESKERYKNEVTKLLGSEYNELLDVISSSKEYIKTERELFFKSQEYINAKQKLDECKIAYENDQSEENKNNFHTALSDLATLNTTINNRLKSKREDIENAKQRLVCLFDDNKDNLIKIRDEIKKELKVKIIQVFKEYQFVINELNKTYNEKGEINVDTFTSKIDDESVFSTFENDYFNKQVESSKVAVVSKPITNLN